MIEHALSSDAAGRIDPPRWAAAEVQLAEWARLCRPDELARMAAELIERLNGDGPGDLRRLLCDACVVPVVLGGHSEPLDVGRARRTSTGPQREALIARDRGWAYVGCHAPPHRCQVHHVRKWIDGRRTAVDMMIIVCVTHHRMIHRAGWTVRMVDGWPEFIPPKWLDINQTPRRKPRGANT
ncbi:MAG: DUF222 domain-containing protein, partial [Pseudonocardia sp.]|nr:DUF222 domain-containing protein [Pseudonocardia sp.]